jgi:hypothetical protein
LYFWVHVLGPRTGDRERLRMFAPDGQALVSVEREATLQDKAQILRWGGKRRGDGWLPGVYRGTYELLRDGKRAVAGEARVRIRP